MRKPFLAALVAATAWGANAQLYTWQFHSVSGSPVSGQITSADPNYPADATFLPSPAVATSSHFFINAWGLDIDFTAALNTALQPPGVGLVPASAPDGASSLWLGPFRGYEPALDLAGIQFTINPAENVPNAPDPQQWEYTGSSGTLSGTGYWELVPVPEPSTSTVWLTSLTALWCAVRRLRKSAPSSRRCQAHTRAWSQREAAVRLRPHW